MDALARAIEAADSGWAVLAIFIIGLYVLVWKYGGQMLALVKDSNHVANQAHEEVKQITKSIITNHDSRNIGDAIDKITAAVHEIRAEVAEIRHHQAQVKIDLDMLKAKSQ